MRKGKGASKKVVIEIGRIGINTFFQHRGKRKEINATAA